MNFYRLKTAPKNITYYLLMVSHCSCWNLHNNFTYYKEEPFTSGSQHLKINGIFYCKNLPDSYIKNYYYGNEFIYLYQDGSIYFGSGINDNLFWSNPDEYLNFIKSNWADFRKSPTNEWGRFIIRADSIFFQVFVYNNQYWMKRNTINYSGRIIVSIRGSTS